MESLAEIEQRLANADPEVRIDALLDAWELQSDRIIYTVAEVSPCILSTDGRVLIYATANHKIVMRDLVADRDLCRLQGHNAPIAFLALSEDRFLASYSIDRQIKIWGIPNPS